jgi:hypothetical protein
VVETEIEREIEIERERESLIAEVNYCAKNHLLLLLLLLLLSQFPTLNAMCCFLTYCGVVMTQACEKSAVKTNAVALAPQNVNSNAKWHTLYDIYFALFWYTL